MEGLTSALSSIGNSNVTKGVMDIAQVGSTGYNMYNQYKNQQYQSQLRDLASDPKKMAAYAQQFTQPLNAGLQTGVANNTQSYLASRGLSESPQISQQVEAQAIAPYIQQNQNQGYSNALQALGLGGGAVNPNTQSASTISALAKAFSQLGGLKPGGMSTPAFQQLMQSGTVQPAQLDPSIYTPDYAGMTDLSAINPAQLDQSAYTPDYGASMGG